jgi:capsular polysaccharide biosynthesis protein
MAEALDEGRILNVAVAESPNVPLIPTNSPWIFGIVGVLLSATVSLGVVFTVEYMDSSFRTPSEVISELNIPVLASVPRHFNGNGHSNGNGNGNGHKGQKPGAGSEVDHYVQQR